MKTKLLKKIVVLSIIALHLPYTIIAQKKVYAYENGKEYFTIELDTDDTNTWGTYRAANHEGMPYFDMTFISDQRQAINGEMVFVMVPTFYSYSYSARIQGVPDTVNTRNQDIKFHFWIKDQGKTLELIKLDSLTRVHFNKISSFDKKDEVDITSIPSEFKLTKKPKWNKFPPGVRTTLAGRLKVQKQKVIKRRNSPKD